MGGERRSGARAIQGIGGGIILSLTQMIIGDIVPLAKRGGANYAAR